MNDFSAPGEPSATQGKGQPREGQPLQNSTDTMYGNDAPREADRQVAERITRPFSIWPHEKITGYPLTEEQAAKQDAKPDELLTMSLADAFKTRHGTPALITSYSTPPGVNHRLNNGYLAAGIHPTFELFWIDVDFHSAASPEEYAAWMVGERVKIANIIAKHSGYWYETKNGYRIVWLMRTPLTIQSEADLDRLRIERAKSLLYLCYKFSINKIDVTCIEPLRGFRLHLVRKGGVDLNLPCGGQWAFWEAPTLSDKDIDRMLDLVEKSNAPLARKIAGKLTRHEIPFYKDEAVATRSTADISELIDNFIVGCGKYPSTSGQGGDDALYLVALKLQWCWGTSGGEALYHMRAYNKYSVDQAGQSYLWPDSKLIRTIARAERATYCKCGQPFGHRRSDAEAQRALADMLTRRAAERAKAAREAEEAAKAKAAAAPVDTNIKPADDATLSNEPAVINAGEWLLELNKEFAVIMLKGKLRIVRELEKPPPYQPPYEFLSETDFKSWLKNVHTTGDKNKILPVAPLWLSSQSRRQYDGITFDPTNTSDDRYFNIWKGYAVKPSAGSCKLFWQHCREVICSGNEGHYQYLRLWLADMVQNPTKRPCVALAFQSDAEGTGKGVFCVYVGGLFGLHYRQITESEHIIGHFNAALEGLLLCNADEACWAGSPKAGDKLRGLISEPTVNIERKGLDPVAVANYIRFIFTSNHRHIVPASTYDRRYYVLQVSPHRVGDRAYFTALLAEMENGGREALLHELQQIDLKGVELRDVPQTEALLEQKLQSLPITDRWWYSCLYNGALVEGYAWSEPRFCTDVYKAYVEFARTLSARPDDPIAFGKKLHELTAPETLKRSNITLSTPQPWGAPKNVRLPGYTMPLLDKCRGIFEKRLRTSITWHSGTDGTAA